MRSASEILEFHFTPMSLGEMAPTPISRGLEQLIENRIDKLRKIIHDIGVASFDFNNEYLIPAVVKKFKLYFLNQDQQFDRKELRTMSYGLSYAQSEQTSIFSEIDELSCALDLLESNWRDSYLYGLLDCYLKIWETVHRSSLIKLSEYVSVKLGQYNGNRSTLKAFKSRFKYFNLKNGDVVLGNELALNNIPISEVTRYLTLPESWITYPYFSRVMVSYYEKKRTEFVNLIDEFEEALRKHGYHRTNKRLISSFIIQANLPDYSSLQDKIKHLAFIYIGDPESPGKWARFENATEKEANNLQEAKNILNQWLTREFISVFFNVCINDERRRNFWQRYSSKITSFKVYGSALTKSVLKKDERISEYLDARYQTVYSNSRISAFILYIEDYMLIEFSDPGYAFYAYKVTGQNRPKLNGKLKNVNDLRNGKMPMLVHKSGEYITKPSLEGRLTHSDGYLSWEDVFSYWLKNVAGIDV